MLGDAVACFLGPRGVNHAHFFERILVLRLPGKVRQRKGVFNHVVQFLRRSRRHETCRLAGRELALLMQALHGPERHAADGVGGRAGGELWERVADVQVPLGTHGAFVGLVVVPVVFGVNVLAVGRLGIVEDAGKRAAQGQDNCLGEACDDVELPFDDASELGCYIVAPNSQDPCLGLAQQLCAFVLNMLDECGSMEVGLPDIGMSAGEIIEAAIEAWSTGVDVAYWQTLLDGLNNAGTITYIAAEPCPIVYPE